MANSTAEIPTVEEVIARAVATSNASTIVSDALERHSSNSSAAAFSPFIVADVKEVNDIPEVTMTQSVYASLNATDVSLPPLPITPLPSSTDTDEALVDSAQTAPTEPISHRPCEISAEPAEDSAAESDDDNDDESEVEQADDENSEHSDDDNKESEDSDDDENSVQSEEDHLPKASPPAPIEAQIPTEIMFLLFVVLLLNSFNFLMTLTGARQCLRPT